MNFKKIIALVLVIALTAAVTFGATVAFLTDETETKYNVFTVGNVDVSLTEKTDDSTVTVVPPTDPEGNPIDGAEYQLVAPGDKLEKEVVVTNNGSLAAYVAVTVKLNNALEINNAIDEYYEAKNYTPEQIQAIYDEVFEGWGINYNPRPGASGKDDARGVIDGAGSVWKLPEEVLQVDFAKTIKGSTVIGRTNWFIAGREKADQYWVDGPAAYDGFYTATMNDYEICYTYYIKLDRNESVKLFEGLNVPDYFVNEQMDMFNGLTIDISGAAIQADNFATPKEAFEALYAQPTPVVPNVPDAVVSSAEDLKEALLLDQASILLTNSIDVPANESNAYGKTALNQKNGGTIDGNGNTISTNAWTTWDSVISTTGGTIKNVTVSGAMRGIFVNHNSANSGPVVLENVIFEDVVYTISCDQGTNQNLIATGCTINGWTSYAATLGNATFTDCYFGEGSGYAYCRPYAPTAFVNCQFEAGFEMDPRAAVTFENCYLDGVLITADNLATLVTSNIANATVK